MYEENNYLKNLLPSVNRTEGDVTSFDPLKIEESIIKETGLDESTAHKITELTVRRIITSRIKFLSGPHIREIVCSILSEQHYEAERKLYTRIGMPLMDYEELLEKGPTDKSRGIMNPEKIHHLAANQIAEEYTLLRILSDEEAHSHLFGNIYIHQLKYFDLRPYSQYWDPRLILKRGLPPVDNLDYTSKLGPAEDLEDAINQLVNWLGMIQSEFCGTQGFKSLSMYLAPYAKDLDYSTIKKEIKRLIYKINYLSLVSGQKYLKTSITCFPTILNEFSSLPAIGKHGKEQGIYGEYNNECFQIFNALIDVLIEGDYNKKQFEFPQLMLFFNDKWLQTYEDSYMKIFENVNRLQNIYLINFCPEWVKMKCIKEIDHKIRNHGTLQKISLNLPRYAYQANKIDEFLLLLKEYLDLSISILNKKYDIIERRLVSNHLPLCSGKLGTESLFKLVNQELSIGFIGLNESVKYLTGHELHESTDTLALGKKIVNEMISICDKASNDYNRFYSIIEDIDNNARYKFTNLDLKHYPKHVITKEIDNRDYYTNSAHFGEGIPMNLKEKVTKQGEYHPLIKDGIFHPISLKEHSYDFPSLRHYTEFLGFLCQETQIYGLKFFP